MRRIQVYVVLPPRLMLLDVAGPLEVLRQANREQNNVRFDVRYIGPSPSVLTSIGILVTSIEPLPAKLPDSAMIVLAGDVDKVMTPSNRTYRDTSMTDQMHEAAIVEWLRAVVRPGHKLLAICSGALMAGKAGLLDGYDCTTHYLCCEKLAAIAPKAKVLENRLYVEDGERYSSAGITAGVDLMLHCGLSPAKWC
jgi:transcriptional regulator GlxA family with amidase domain